MTYLLNRLRGLWMGESWGLRIFDVIVLTVMLAAGKLCSARSFYREQEPPANR